MNSAAIDIGTNSVRLLINDPTGSELVREMNITRLGQGVDQTGELAPAAIARTLEVLDQYATLLRAHAPYKLRMTATSAARDSKNRDYFFASVAQVVGQAPELLSGAEEARLSFLGACAGLPLDQGPFMVFDIGGGSTEFAFGTTHPEAFISVDMGGVRITERFLTEDPPTPAQIAAAEAYVESLLSRVDAAIDWRAARTWLGLAGSVTTFAAAAAGLQRYDASVTHGYLLERAAVEDFTAKLLAIPASERRALLLDPKRAEVIVGGAIVLRTVYRHYGLMAIRSSERDILDGLAASVSAI